MWGAISTHPCNGGNMPGLIEGRIVHYVAYNNRHLAALVIGFEQTSADLAVFTNMDNVQGIKNFGMQFHQDVQYSETQEPGTWHWVEKA
jgi:hypothetical protein